MGAAYSSLGPTKVLYATSFVLLGAKAKFLRSYMYSKLLWKNFLKCVDPNPYYQRWLHVYQGFLLTERFPRFGSEGNSQRVFVGGADAKSLSWSDIRPH